MKLLGGIFTIIAALITAFWGGTKISSTQNQSTIVNIPMQETSIQTNDVQERYNTLEEKYNALEERYSELQNENELLRNEIEYTNERLQTGTNSELDLAAKSAASADDRMEERINPPIYLETIDTLSNTGGYGEIWIIDSDPQHNYKDNIGNRYLHGVGVIFDSFNNWSTWRKIEYYLGGKYVSLKGTLILSYETRDTNGSVQLRINADDNLVYSSPDITNGILPIEIDLDITNATKLILYFESCVNSGKIDVAIANAALSQEK